MAQDIVHTLPADFETERLDVTLFDLKLYVSRAQSKRAIEKGNIRLNGNLVKPGVRVKAGDVISIHLPDIAPGAEPEDIPLDIIYEDEHIVVVDKAPGMVVHPAAGNRTGTLVNALLHHCDNLSGIGGVLRPGVVHRLDKDTSGVIVLAKNDAAHLDIANQFRDRTVKKVYLAVIIGRMRETSGLIEDAISRNVRHRTKMKAGSIEDGARAASTEWRELEAYPGASLLEVLPRTGRTHQIRVHLSEKGHPVVGDKVYGTKKRLKGVQNEQARLALENMKRQALHAHKLTLKHPATGEAMTFTSELPEDMRRLIMTLRNAAAK